MHAGGERFGYIPCLNEDSAWIDALAQLSIRHMGHWLAQTSDPAELALQQQRARALGAQA